MYGPLSARTTPPLCEYRRPRLEETSCVLKTGKYQGARAFEVHLPLLEFPDGAALGRITNATSRPIYAACRRDAFYELLGADDVVDMDDGERIERLVAAVGPA